MSPYKEILYTTISPVIAGFVVVLNLLQLLSIFKLNKKRRKVTTSLIYVSSLSVSDVLVGVVMIIMKSIDPFLETTLKHNVVAEEIHGILKHVFVRFSLFTSIFNLIALTFDRFMAVKYPLKHRRYGEYIAVKVCVLIWLLSFACVVGIYCISRFHLSDVDKYNNIIFPMFSYPATIIFVTTYSFIYMKIRGSSIRLSHSKRKRKTEAAAESTTALTRNNAENSLSTKGNSARNKKEMKFVKLAVMIVFLFSICWLPFSTCKLLIALGGSCGGKTVERTLFTLAFSNSLINPFVYFGNFRKQSKAMVIQTSLLLQSRLSSFRESGMKAQETSDNDAISENT